jgi:hypothetical protein
VDKKRVHNRNISNNNLPKNIKGFLLVKFTYVTKTSPFLRI